jgi:hypothetical protein
MTKHCHVVNPLPRLAYPTLLCQLILSLSTFPLGLMAHLFLELDVYKMWLHPI